MKYFTYLAEQSFKTDATGQRVFYRGGPWSRPYIIPDDEIEKRLFKKQLWYMRIVMGGLIVSIPLLFTTFPSITEDALKFLIFMVAVTLASWLASYLVFRPELNKLSQTSTRVSLKTFYINTARKHSLTKLILGFIACLAFVAIGFSNGGNPFINWVCIILFGVLSLAWAYMIYLRMTMLRRDNDL